MTLLNNKADRTPDRKTRVLIVDDHPVVREGLTALIDHERDMMVCGQADDAEAALQAAAKLKPDVAVVDISLKRSDGLDLTKSFKAGFPALFVIVLSVHDESIYAERALLAGAHGYVMKDVASDHIIKAIRTVIGGDIFVSNAVSKKFLHAIARDGADPLKTPVENLSDRELEVFRLIGEGYKTTQIAERLFLSPKTIETYRSRIKDKLSLANAAELLRYAIKWTKSQEGRG